MNMFFRRSIRREGRNIQLVLAAISIVLILMMGTVQTASAFLASETAHAAVFYRNSSGSCGDLGSKIQARFEWDISGGTNNTNTMTIHEKGNESNSKNNVFGAFHFVEEPVYGYYLVSTTKYYPGIEAYANFRNYTQFSVNQTITEPTNSFSSPPVVHMISSADSYTANMSTAKDEYEIIISQTSTDIISSYNTISSTGSVLHSFNLDQPFSGVTLAPPYHHYAVSDAIEGLDPNEGYALVNSGTDFQIESLISPSTITDFTGHEVQSYTGGLGNNGLTVSCTNANIGSFVDEEGNSATYTLPTTWHGTSTSGNEVYQYYEVT